MGKNRIFTAYFTGFLVLLIGAFMIGMPLLAKSAAKPSLAGAPGIHLFGIIDPEGRKHIWALPAESANDITRRLAAKYPRKSIDGITFHSVRSWRDTANLVIEAQAQQGALIVDLSNKIERLKKFGTDRKLTGRVTRLEKRLNEITDSGYR